MDTTVLIGTLLVFAFVAMAVGYVTREKLLWAVERDRVATDIIQGTFLMVRFLWIPLYRHRHRIDKEFRPMIATYFWSNVASIGFWAAALAVYLLAA